MREVFLGVDLGSSGMRLVAIDSQGSLLASASQGWEGAEPDPRRWLATLSDLLRRVRSPDRQPVAISACSTSGSIVPLDVRGDPLGLALLYDDPRGKAEAQELGIPASWGLGRWLWWIRSQPESYLAHPTDFLLAQLSGQGGLTDHTSALKSGFDLAAYAWPTAWLEAHGLAAERFPAVVAPGSVLGRALPQWDLGQEVLVVAGCTDGCAGQLAAGAARQVTTSLGTTLIFKASSPTRIQTADGSVYSHLDPDRRAWWPGAASSCGGGALAHHFPGEDYAEWDRRAAEWLPTESISYPLWRKGERFPVTDPDFGGFLPDAPPQTPRFYAALLEGVACVERLGLERLGRLGIPLPERILTTGGGSRSPLWLQVRASLLGRELALPRHPDPAVGAAILAAAAHWQCSVETASQRIVRVGNVVEPRPEWIRAYQDLYGRFLERLGPRLG